MLWRQWLLKRRSLASTIVEVLSPIVLISMLVGRLHCRAATLLQQTPACNPCIAIFYTAIQVGHVRALGSSKPKIQHYAVFCIQVVAYLEVTPDVMPAKIYVNETAQALRDFMQPFSQIHPEPSSSNCTDLLIRVMIAGMQWFPQTSSKLSYPSVRTADPFGCVIC